MFDFEDKKGKGYINKSMSVNAHNAYLNEEMPLSKWTKAEIISSIKYINESLDDDLLKKITLKDLQKNMLRQTAWHHTGSFYSITWFYEIKEEYIENLINDDLVKIIEEHKEFLNKTKTERKAALVEIEKKRAVKRQEKQYEANLKDLLKITKYKTLTGLKNAIERGTLTLEDLLEMKEEAISKRREELKKTWQNQPHMLERIDDDDFIYSYVK